MLARRECPFLQLDDEDQDADAIQSDEQATVKFFNDNVHTKPEGAEFNARTLAEEIRDLQGSDLSNYL